MRIIYEIQSASVKFYWLDWYSQTNPLRASLVRLSSGYNIGILEEEGLNRSKFNSLFLSLSFVNLELMK